MTPAAGGLAEPSDLPDHVVLKMLHREVLLTKAKLHALNYEQAVAERKLRTLKSQLRQVTLQSPASIFLAFQSQRKAETPSAMRCCLPRSILLLNIDVQVCVGDRVGGA